MRVKTSFHILSSVVLLALGLRAVSFASGDVSVPAAPIATTVANTVATTPAISTPNTGSAPFNSHGFRDVRVFSPLTGEITGVIILMTPATKGDEALALPRRFSEEGFLVIAVDPVRFSLPKLARQCKEFSDCLVALSAAAQKTKNLSVNFLPTIVSVGASGEFAEISWREAPQSAFNAVVSVDYCPKSKSAPRLMSERHTQWSILESPARDKNCKTLSSGLIALMDIERDALNNDPVFRPGQMIRWVKKRLAAIDPSRDRLPAAIDRHSIDDLQAVLVEPEKNGHYDAFVILYSGDGGWAEFTDELAAEFSHKKLPVVGINSMRYFWKEKTPERGAEDLARMIRYYKEKWGATTVHLVGFSFGAGTLPFFVRRLPPELQKSIGRVALLAPYRKAGFEFFLTDWLYDDDRGQDVMPEVRGLTAALKPLCIYPSSEKNASLCTQSKDAPLVPIELPGSHHFNGETAKVVEAMLGTSASKTSALTKKELK